MFFPIKSMPFFLFVSATTDVPAPEELSEFANAEYFGKAYGSCDEAFSQCPLSLFNVME